MIIDLHVFSEALLSVNKNVEGIAPNLPLNIMNGLTKSLVIHNDLSLSLPPSLSKTMDKALMQTL